MVIMTKKVYSQEFKEQVAKEAVEVGNTSLVARKHGVSQKSLNNWVQASKGKSKKRSVRNLEQVRKDIEATPEQLQDALKQNNKLKNLLGERELEIAVLRDLLKKTNIPLPTR
jgi:transposase-like protein